MENFNQQQADELLQRVQNDPSIHVQLTSLWSYLMDSEYELILFMVAEKVWKGPVPPPPAGFQLGDGTIELGLFRYWAQEPWKLDYSKFSAWEIAAILAFCYIIDKESPQSQMNDTNAAFFDNDELIYTDGSVLSSATYATYDQGWFVAFLNLVNTVIYGYWYNGGTFPTGTPPQISLSGATPGEINIALVGDWGTGDTTAKDIMQRIVALKPDYIVHVGDVYYSGSPAAGDAGQSTWKYLDAGEEVDHLVEGWPATYVGRSFTLNSNHEMYSGANGYFLDALMAGKSVPGAPFIAQKGSSCFALQFGGWTILGLDTAFMGTSLDAFMTGSIGGTGGTQGQWISGLQLDPQKVIVLTHHNGFAFDCSSLSSLWNEISGALNGDPYAWYWGHVHYGVAYDSPITIPSVPGQPGLTTKTFSRCLGHGALPYGPASSLKGQPVVWSSGNMQPPPSKQLYNGFAVLTLTTNAGGEVTAIKENFYDLSTEDAVWSDQIL